MSGLATRRDTEAHALTVWQIGAPVFRDYAEVFLQHGVGLIGPGDRGPWSSKRDIYGSKSASIRQFANEAREGDIVLLRTGRSTIGAVGTVASGYLYLSAFDDVNGWDMQHARRIRWCRLPDDHDFGEPVFGARTQSFNRIWKPSVCDYARRFVHSAPMDWQSAPLPPLPQEEPLLADVPGPLREIVATAQDLHALYWSRTDLGDLPVEDELLAHLVIPFFRSLGWSPECIAVKWRNIDVSIFRRLPRSPDNCRLVVEAKRLGSGVEVALKQAMGYVRELGVPRDVLVTDGIRYRLYSHESGFDSVAYANLARLKRSASQLFERLERREEALHGTMV